MISISQEPHVDSGSQVDYTGLLIYSGHMALILRDQISEPSQDTQPIRADYAGEAGIHIGAYIRLKFSFLLGD